jgi:nucleoside-triphosphatase THEP1
MTEEHLHKRKAPSVIILAGPVQSGKSSLLTDLACILREKGLKISGIIARGLLENGARSGFDIIDLADGSITPLSRRVPDGKTSNGIPYVFYDSGLAAGMKALSAERCSGADFVMVDEVGILESRGFGWAKCLDPLLELDGPVHIWVVRSGCLEPVCQKWGLYDAEIVMVEEADALNRLLHACMKRVKGRA